MTDNRIILNRKRLQAVNAIINTLEGEYEKVMQGCQTSLTFLKREAGVLGDKRKNPSGRDVSVITRDLNSVKSRLDRNSAMQKAYNNTVIFIKKATDEIQSMTEQRDEILSGLDEGYISEENEATISDWVEELKKKSKDFEFELRQLGQAKRELYPRHVVDTMANAGGKYLYARRHGWNSPPEKRREKEREWVERDGLLASPVANAYYRMRAILDELVLDPLNLIGSKITNIYPTTKIAYSMDRYGLPDPRRGGSGSKATKISSEYNILFPQDTPFFGSIIKAMSGIVNMLSPEDPLFLGVTKSLEEQVGDQPTKRKNDLQGDYDEHGDGQEEHTAPRASRRWR